VALTVLVAWFILDRVGLSVADLENVDPARWTPRWGIFLVSCLVLLLGYVLSGVIWGVMVRDMGGSRLPPATAVRVWLVANLGRYIPGKLWQIAGLALLARERGVSARVATGAAVLGQGIALMAAALVGAVALLGAGPVYRTAGVWTLGILLVLGGVALAPPVLERLVSAWYRLARVDPPETDEPGPGRVLRWGALYVLNWVVYAFSFWILVKSFDLPGTLLETAPAFAAAYFLGYVAVFAPAGVGVREGFLTVFLGPVMGAGTAVVLSVVTRVWTTGVEVLPAGALWLDRLSRGGPSDARGGDA
jgi:uncharacterized membrane protein YbhN (UPF0104 family)